MMTTATMPIYADDADDADGHNMARMSLGRIEQLQNCVWKSQQGAEQNWGGMVGGAWGT